MSFFEKYCRGKSVLHVGCTDLPIFNPDNNLHIQLEPMTTKLHGLDTDVEGCRTLAKYVKQPYFNKFSEATGHYDVCLIPETIEHVENVGAFLKDVATIDAEYIIITGPNCFAQHHMRRNTFDYENESLEVVHPDHNAWYSPYTLKNVIEKYSGLSVIETAVIQYECSVACVCKKS